MANPSLQIGNDNWAIKEDNLLGYSTAGTRFVPQPITMTRATLGTRVNPSGLVEDVELLGSELVTNGDFATDSDWTKGTGWTISGGKAVAVAGTSSRLEQSISGLSGKYCKINLTISDYGGGGSIYIDFGSSNSSLINTNGEHTVYGAFDQNKFEIFKGGAFSGSIDNVSVKEATIDNLPRVDYTDGTSSLLVEPQRTNNLSSSQDLTDLFWNSINVETIVASTVLSPDGTTFGFKAIPNNTTNKHYIDYDFGFLSMPSGVEATYSVFVKPFGYTNFQLASSTSFAARYQNFELTGDGVIGTGDVNSATIEKIGDWYRCSITETTTGTTPRVLNIATPSSGLGRNPTWLGNGTDGVLLWGAQLEEGSFLTSYIPNLSTTSGSTVTRNQETYTKTGISDLINSTEGVLFLDLNPKYLNSINRYITIFDSTNVLNKIHIKFEMNLNIQVRYYVNNVVSFTDTYVQSDFTNIKIALKWKANDFALWINGNEEASQLSGTVNVASTFDTLSLAYTSGILNFNGKVKQLQVFKTALSDSELATLTT